MATGAITSILILVLSPFSVTDTLAQTNVVSDCQANVDCHSTEVCSNGKCLNPCLFVTCGLHTVCHSTNHSAACTCPIGTTWDPIVGCKRLDNPECINNINCALEEICHNKICQDPCKSTFCGDNTGCTTHNHTAMCFCKPGYSGSPLTGCVENNCQSNVDCHSTEVCSNGKCLDPCQFVTCGLHTVCHTTNHSAACACPVGTTWDPVIGCKRLENSVKIKKFKLFQDKERTWQEALHHCKSLGMKLATINSQQEQDEVQKQATLFDSKWAWLGGSDLGDTGNYTWMSTNTTITYTNWYPGEPDNYKYLTGDEDHCIVIRFNGKWYDGLCHDQYYPICEYYD